MNRGASVIIILILSLSLLPFTVSAIGYTNVSVSEANNMIDSKPSLVVLDVRTQSEYDSGHIRKAKLIPVSELEGRLNELDKTREILVYCRTGNRSVTASQILSDNGFLYVYNMLGGVTAWIDAGYPVYVKYSSIQEAINNATEGSKIFVSSGTYYEHLVVNKTIGLMGEDSENTIVYGDGKQPVLKLAYHRANVTGFKIQNGTKGVYIFDDAYSCIISDCNIVNNGIGVFVENSDSNLVKGNIVFNNSEMGIKIFSTSCCYPVWENNVMDNALVNNSIGVMVINSQLGMIYHNSFIDNVFQAYGSSNATWEMPDKWDNGYPSGGNYWNDYAGVDLFNGPGQNLTGSDLIGDTHYVFDKNNRDRYPLMGPWTREGRSVNVISSTGLTLLFEKVISAGITTFQKNETGPNPPSGYKLAEKYYHTRTMAGYYGNIKIKISYEGLNMTQDEEEMSRLMQWNATSGRWMDVTTSRDTQKNLIFGETSHLSIFALFTPTLILHNIAVTKVEPSQTFIEQGLSMFIYVTVQNKGNFSETFNLTAFYDLNIIETKSTFLNVGASKIVAFSWNTTSVPSGDYVISAYASPVPGETNTTDNTKVADSLVTVSSWAHDVAAEDLVISKTVVGQGYSMVINVTAKNFGNFTETFNVRVYADIDTAIIGDEVTVGVRNVTLASGSFVKIVFLWNTTGIAKGNYTISAKADTVLGEKDTSNNVCVDGWVVVAMVGDITGPNGFPDGKVDMRDVAAVAKLFGISNPNPKYDPNCDLTGSTSGMADGKIDMKDVAVVAKEFGKTS